MHMHKTQYWNFSFNILYFWLDKLVSITSWYKIIIYIPN